MNHPGPLGARDLTSEIETGHRCSRMDVVRISAAPWRCPCPPGRRGPSARSASDDRRSTGGAVPCQEFWGQSGQVERRIMAPEPHWPSGWGGGEGAELITPSHIPRLPSRNPGRPSGGLAGAVRAIVRGRAGSLFVMRWVVPLPCPPPSPHAHPCGGDTSPLPLPRTAPHLAPGVVER